MTDISTSAPTAARRLKPLRVGFPWLAIGASICATPIAIGNALRMVYVDPYTGRRSPQSVPDDDLEGRDPNW